MTFGEYGFTIEDYLTKELNLRMERGGRYVCCPLHDENTASFRYYADEDTFYCFGCDVGGDVVVLHRELAKRDGRLMNYGQALQEVRHIVYKHTGNAAVLENKKREDNKVCEKDGNRVVTRKKTVSTATTVSKQDEVVSESSNDVSAGVATPVGEKSVSSMNNKPKTLNSLELLQAVQSARSALREKDFVTAQRQLFRLEAHG